MGARSARIVLRQVLPNTQSSIIVLATLQVALATPQGGRAVVPRCGNGKRVPDLGQVIAQGRDVVDGRVVAVALPRARESSVRVVSINLVGDRLRDALDPRST